VNITLRLTDEPVKVFGGDGVPTPPPKPVP